MKKILLFFTLFIFSLGTITSQEDDLSALLGALGDNQAVKDFNFGQYIDPATTTADLTVILQEEGFDDASIAALTPVLDAIANDANGNVSLAELEASNPTLYDDAENAILQIVAAEAAAEFFNGPEGAQLEDQINSLSMALKALSGFGQANAQGSRASSLFGYQGYDTFAFSFGMTTAVATDDPNSFYNISQSSDANAQLEKKINDSGIAAGISIQGFTANVGINMNWLLDNLYLGAIIGYTGVKVDPTDIIVEPLGIPVNVGASPSELAEMGLQANMSALTIGVTGNYQLIQPYEIPFLFRWNGLSLGTGIIFNNYTIGAKADLSSLFPSPDGSPTPSNSFVATFDISNNSVTIPLDASTGVRFLSIFNLSIGAGLDLQMGGSNVSFNLEGPATDNLSTKLMVAVLDEVLERGGMAFPYSQDHNINFFNPRLNAGLGIGIGPATLLDVTATYYFRSGLTIGAGFVFRI